VLRLPQGTKAAVVGGAPRYRTLPTDTSSLSKRRKNLRGQQGEQLGSAAADANAAQGGCGVGEERVLRLVPFHSSRVAALLRAARCKSAYMKGALMVTAIILVSTWRRACLFSEPAGCYARVPHRYSSSWLCTTNAPSIVKDNAWRHFDRMILI
jgi:hypothetical protein